MALASYTSQTAHHIYSSWCISQPSMYAVGCCQPVQSCMAHTSRSCFVCTSTQHVTTRYTPVRRYCEADYVSSTLLRLPCRHTHHARLQTLHVPCQSISSTIPLSLLSGIHTSISTPSRGCLPTIYAYHHANHHSFIKTTMTTTPNKSDLPVYDCPVHGPWSEFSRTIVISKVILLIQLYAS